MKQMWTMLLILLCITAYTQEGSLPGQVKTAFEARYPQSKMGSWWMENQLYYMDFTYLGGSFTAAFDERGEWKETAETISEMYIPGALKDFIRSNFPSGSICFCEKVEAIDKQQFLRITVIDEGNVDRIVRADLDGGNIEIVVPQTV